MVRALRKISNARTTSIITYFAVTKLRLIRKIFKYSWTFIQQSGLNFRTGWRDSSPKFRNPVGKNHEDRRLPPWKILVFRIFLHLWIETPRFRKIHQFSCNAGQFLNVRGNFLLSIGGASFPILPGIGCNSIPKFRTEFRNIAYFSGFRGNNCIYTKW